MSTKENHDNENTHHQEDYAQRIMELPKTNGWWSKEIFLYQGHWFYRSALLGCMLMQQNHFIPRSGDIFLSAFAKCGTTWLRSLMFSTLNRSRFEFNANHPLLHQGPHDCFPQLELSLAGQYNDELINISNSRAVDEGHLNFQQTSATNLSKLDMAFDDLPSPHLFATHIPYTSFPPFIIDACKFVYICRDPKDVLVSTFHFYQKLRSKELPPLSFDQAFERFCQGDFECGPYWDHVLGFWKASLESPDKILFLKYEEFKHEPEIHVKRLADFMGVPISIEEQENGVIENIVSFCSFENMKNRDVNKTGIQRFTKDDAEVENQLFFRKGEVGDWENYLTTQMQKRIDGITQDKLKGSGLILGTK